MRQEASGGPSYVHTQDCLSGREREVHFENTWSEAFPEDKRVQGRFVDYANTWLKMRQEASGGPSYVRTEKELQ